jgi:hypothetical protein
MHTYKVKHMLFIIKKFIIKKLKKNWSNDSRNNYKPPSNLVEMIEKDLYLEDKLEEFEGSFE